MSTHNSSINYSIKEEATEGGEYTMENDNILLNATGDQDEKKKRASSDHVGGSVKKGGASNGGGGASSMRCCQAEKCTADLTDAKQYHRRHKVCEEHAKAQMVVVAGIRQRFCQQCSRFHELSEFDEAKRSCRRRLAGHNERRRKTQVDHSHAEGSNRKGTCGQVDDRGRIQISIQENATYKTFQDQIRSR